MNYFKFDCRHRAYFSCWLRVYVWLKKYPIIVWLFICNGISDQCSRCFIYVTSHDCSHVTTFGLPLLLVSLWILDLFAILVYMNCCDQFSEFSLAGIKSGASSFKKEDDKMGNESQKTQYPREALAHLLSLVESQSHPRYICEIPLIVWLKWWLILSNSKVNDVICLNNSISIN